MFDQVCNRIYQLLHYSAQKKLVHYKINVIRIIMRYTFILCTFSIADVYMFGYILSQTT
jgi:hypothetical protein